MAPNTLVCALTWIAQRIRLPAPLLYLPGGMLYELPASTWPQLPFDAGVVDVAVLSKVDEAFSAAPHAFGGGRAADDD